MVAGGAALSPPLAGLSPLLGEVAVVAAVAGTARAGVAVLVAAGPRLTEPLLRAARTLAVCAPARDSARLPLRPTLVGPSCVC